MENNFSDITSNSADYQPLLYVAYTSVIILYVYVLQLQNVVYIYTRGHTPFRST